MTETKKELFLHLIHKPSENDGENQDEEESNERRVDFFHTLIDFEI